MKLYFVFSFVFTLALSAQAIEWKIYGACSDKPVHEGYHKASMDQSVGAISVEIFTENGLPFIGSEAGINSLLNTPVGMDAIEIVSDSEARIYGWCFSINGKIPEAMPNKLMFDSHRDELVWFFAYSTNKENKWLDYCVPAHTIKAPQFCSK